MKKYIGVLSALVLLLFQSAATAAADNTPDVAGHVALSCTYKDLKPAFILLNPAADGSAPSKVSAGTFTAPSGDRFTIRDSDIQNGQVKGFEVSFRNGQKAEVPVKGSLLNLPAWAKERGLQYNRCSLVTISGGMEALAKIQNHSGKPNEALPTTDAGVTTAAETPRDGLRSQGTLVYAPHASEDKEQYWIDRGYLPGRPLNRFTRPAPLKSETPAGTDN